MLRVILMSSLLIFTGCISTKIKPNEIDTESEIVNINGMEYQNRPFKKYSWEDGKEYCENLNLKGRGWRLPNNNELIALLTVEYYGEMYKGDWEQWFYKNKSKMGRNSKGGQFFIKQEFLKNMSSMYVDGQFWSSDDSDSTFASTIDFGSASKVPDFKKSRKYVLCVRK